MSYISENLARQTSIQKNNIDCLKSMYLQSRQNIRKFEKSRKKRDSNDEISNLIDSFFILNEEGKVWSYPSP